MLEGEIDMFTLQDLTHDCLVGVHHTIAEARQHAQARSVQFGRVVYRIQVWPYAGVSYSIAVVIYDGGHFVEEWADDSGETVTELTKRWSQPSWRIAGPGGQSYAYWTREAAEVAAECNPGFVVRRTTSSRKHKAYCVFALSPDDGREHFVSAHPDTREGWFAAYEVANQHRPSAIHSAVLDTSPWAE